MLQSAEYPPAPSDASDVDTLLAHQTVIASSHPDGSYFMTQEGQSHPYLDNASLCHLQASMSSSSMVSWPMWTSPPVPPCLSPIPSLSSRWYWTWSRWNSETQNVTFQTPNVGQGPIQGVLNAAYPGYPSYSQPQATPASYPQPQQQLMGYPAQNIHHINQTQPVYNQFQQQAQPVSHPQQVKKGLLYKLLSLSLSSGPSCKSTSLRSDPIR